MSRDELSVRRTHTHFCRNHVDMTHEQTLHADVASRPADISFFQLSVAARNRWNVARSTHSVIVGLLMSEADI